LSARLRHGIGQGVVSSVPQSDSGAAAEDARPRGATLPWTEIALVLALGAAVLFAGLGGYPLLDPTEGRHAAVAREMAENGRWLVPVLYGESYYDKPAPFYWLLRAVGLLPLGGETAARMPSAVATLATALLVYGFARRRFGSRPALLGAAVFLTCPAVVSLARVANQDALLAACVTAATLRWLAWLDDPGPPPWSAYALMGAGALVKGPVAIVLPLLVAATGAMARGAARERARQAGLVRGMALSLGLFLVWLAPAALEDPRYVRAFLLEHNVARYLTAEVGHPKPSWFLIPTVAALLLPWTLALPAALLVPAGDDTAPMVRRSERDLLLWAAVIIAFFSLGRAKLATYALPAVAPISLWIGLRLDRLTHAAGARRDVAESRMRAAIAIWALALAVAPVATWLFLRTEFPRLAPHAAIALALPVIGALGWRLGRRAPCRAGPIAFGAGNAAIAIVGYLAAAPLAAQIASDAGIARTAAALAPGVTIVGFRVHPASLSFYADAPVRKAREVAPVLRLAEAGPLLVVTREEDVEALRDAGLSLYRWTECERHCLFGTLPRPDRSPAPAGDAPRPPEEPSAGAPGDGRPS
jgi:4-amino-4-deoxy-L-arabinose transferase-like glycosyltransferase